MTAPGHPQAVADLLDAIEASAQDCRRAYRCRTELYGLTVLNDFQYERLERLIASGRAPAWLQAEWEHGAFVRAQRWRRP